MRKIFGIVAALAILIGTGTGTALLIRSRSAAAQSVGPTLSVGTPSLVNGEVRVPIVASGSDFAPYTDGKIGLTWDPSIFAFAGISTQGTIYQGGGCALAFASDHEARISCTASSPTTATGALSAIALTPIGAGCSLLHIVTAGAPDFAGQYGSFTADAISGLPDKNPYGPDAGVNQSGVPCVPAATASPSPTRTFTPTPTITSTPTSTPTPNLHGPAFSFGTATVILPHTIQIPIVLSGTAVAPYSFFRAHVRVDPAVFSSISFRGAGVFAQNCTGGTDSDGAGGALACSPPSDGPTTTATGVLGYLQLFGFGTDCSFLHFVTSGPPDNADGLGTYTAAGIVIESNTYTDGAVDVAGNACSAAPTPTATATATPTETPLNSATPTPTFFGGGPDIVVGEPSFDAGDVLIPIDTAGTIFAPYGGFALHLTWDPAVFRFAAADVTGSVLDLSCQEPLVDPGLGGVEYRCSSVGGVNTTSTGRLVDITLTPVGNGCSALRLRTETVPLTNTYTTTADGAVQANTLVDGSADQAGEACAVATATATATPTATATGTDTPTPTATPTITPTPSGTVTMLPTDIFAVQPTACLALLGGTSAALTCFEVGELESANSLDFVADALGGHAGVPQPSDFTTVDALDARQIHQGDGTLAIVAFVSNESPVTFRTNAGVFADSGTDTAVCDANTAAFERDADCVSASNLGSEDHVVVRYLTCTQATCPFLGPAIVTVEQDGVVRPIELTVVGEPVSVSFSALQTSVSSGALPAVPQCADKPLPSQFEQLPPTEMVLIASARDIDGRSVAGAWFLFSTGDPNQIILASQVLPTLDLGVFGFGAPEIICSAPGATPAVVGVGARLIRSQFGVALDPDADPLTDPGDLGTESLASATFNVQIVAPVTATPTEADTAVPTTTKTSTVTATVTPAPTDTSAPAATDTPVPTATDTPVPPATDTPAPTATDTPAPTATNTAVPTATNTELATATDTAVATATATPAATTTRTPTAGRTTTPQSTRTAGATRSPASTRTAAAPTRTPVPTATVAPQRCLTLGRKIALAIDILRRLGAHQGQRRYRARDDVNGDGVIDLADLLAVIDAPPCHRRR